MLKSSFEGSGVNDIKVNDYPYRHLYCKTYYRKRGAKQKNNHSILEIFYNMEQQKNTQKEEISRKEALKKIGKYGKYAALTAIGTYTILSPKKAQAK